MKVVTDFAEVEKRPDYKPETEINLENFKSLVFEYEFGDWVQCQVKSRKDKRKLCEHDHMHGWLGKTKDGPEGLIGSHCGLKYFKDHEGFKVERKRLDDAKALTERIEQLEGLLLNAESLEIVVKQTAATHVALVAPSST